MMFFKIELLAIEDFYENNVLPKEFSPSRWEKVIDSNKCFLSHIDMIKNSKSEKLAKIPLKRITRYIKFLKENDLVF